MGWSCRADAARTADKWSEACRKSTGSSNVWTENGKRYFYETSNTEHRDGAITGTIWRFIGNEHAVRAGSFRINPDGDIGRAPAFLKKAAA